MNDKNLLHLLMPERADYVPSNEDILRFIDALHPDYVHQDCWAIRTPGTDGLTAYAGAARMDREFLPEEIETLGVDVALIAEPNDDSRLRALIPSSTGQRLEGGLSLVRATDFMIPPHGQNLRYRPPRCTACGRPLRRTPVSVASECGHCSTACDLTDEEWNLYDYWDGSLRTTPRTLFTRFAIVYDCSTDWPPQHQVPYPDLIQDELFVEAATDLCGGRLLQFPVIAE